LEGVNKISKFKDKSKMSIHMKYFQVYLLILLVIVACQRSGDSSAPSSDLSVSQSESVTGSEPVYEKSFRSDAVSEVPEEPFEERRIIKVGWLRVEIKNYSGDLATIKGIIVKHKGYISNENESSTDYSLENNLLIRVPSIEFDLLVEEIVKMAYKVDNKSITLNDVTEEFIDVEARLKIKKEVEKRYLEILDRAGTVQDILLVEQQLRIIREEIEAKEGRLKYLQNQVSLSTLNLEIHQDLAAKPGFKFIDKLAEALKGGWKGLLNIFVGLIYVWPLILVITVVIFWLIIRRRKKRGVN
jgi:hypothetical protein